MSTPYRFSILLRWSALIALGVSVVFGCSSVRSEEPVPTELTPEDSDSEDYWTPERLKNAKPLEIPHPPTPFPQPSTPPSKSTPPAPSSTAPGHIGDDDVLPDESNRLFEGVESRPGY